MTLRRNSRSTTVYSTIALLCGTTALAAKHPKKEDSSTLPSDPNLASLRVSATMSLYELDASSEQLKLIKAAAAGAASTRVRTAAKGAAKLVKPMDDLETAILSGADDGKIAELRNALVEAASADDVQLDDPVRPTAAALSKAPTVTHTLHASQLAAYLAAHADEVGDPVERMVSAVGQDDTDAATDVAELVVGNDTEKSKALADKVGDWIKAHANLEEADAVKDRAALEASASKVIGDVSSVEVLSHWLDREMATLLSNPELPAACDAMLAGKKKAG